MSNKVFDTERAAAYYDDAAVSEFYQQCWGGENIQPSPLTFGNLCLPGVASAYPVKQIKQTGKN